ncbi:glycoside hydrolase family 32 protein [Devosia sp.]|uniref:glycoside hydrolase family 32 protein n=1 Tax=Devosia sp. TaxID=1871048 RepID=UPI0025E0E1E8|nr:glycoside hydrolase family 32 protein [Devosia sp.]MCR6634239.1 glycoside hydrolase family 32 protein [Devosia sp.]
MQANVTLAAGYRLEFWAEGPGTIRITEGEALLWRVPALAAHPEFFSYQHREASSITLDCDRPEAILWAYGYDPNTVEHAGITVWEFGADGVVLRSGSEIHDWMASDPLRPTLHFSPIRQWMNDPNGLCRIGDTWHMFYQFHPAGTDWGPMHWGHAVSKDLFNWTHMPVFLHPDQNLWRLGATGGAFSGNAFRDRNGSQIFFYTERLPAYDLFTGYREIQKLGRPDRSMLYLSDAETILDTRPVDEGVEHDFRDPKVWWDEGAGAYRMVLGAALHGDPAVLLYGSPNLTDWTYLGPLYRAPAHYRQNGARAVECPDFFPLDGKWVMIMGFVGYTEPESGRHNLLFAIVGDFRNDTFVPSTGDLQILDFGTDYYAMQSFAADERQIAFAWLFNWEYRKPPGSPYSGEMSLPRELALDPSGRLLMRPARELDKAWPTRLLPPELDGSFALGDVPTEIRLKGALEGTRIMAMSGSALSFEVTILNGRLSIRLPQDDGKIRYDAALESATDLLVFHDRGILEVFGEGGAVCGTRRSYTNITPDRIVVTSAAEVCVFERKSASAS